AFASLPLIVHGQSLGSLMAGHVAAGRTLDGLVLESSITTTDDWIGHARAQRPLWQRALVRRVNVDTALSGLGNLLVAHALDEPVLFVVGELDTLTPPAFSRRLFDAAPGPADRKTLLVVRGAGHNDAALSPAFREAMRAFVARAASRHESGSTT